MTTPKKPAMAECQGCHYRFPKPEMKKVVTSVGGGYSPPRTTTKLNKNWQPTGYSQSQGTYRQGRQKTLWFCSECYEKRKTGQIRLFRYGVLVAVALLLVINISPASKRERPDGAVVSQAGEEQQSSAGSQIQDANSLLQEQIDEAAVSPEYEIGMSGNEPVAEPDEATVADTSTGGGVPGIASLSSPGGVRTSNVIALRAAVAAAATTRKSQTWSHYAESGSVVVQGVDPSSQCPIMYFTVNEESWQSAAVPVCPGQSIVD